MEGHVIHAIIQRRFRRRNHFACDTADVFCIAVDGYVSQMQVFDNAVCADYIEQTDVFFAVAHNIEILDDVAVAVKRTVKARDSGCSLCLCRGHEQTAVDRCDLAFSRFENVFEICSVAAPR